jgi:thioredoxin-dependent peroxiredoxin
MLNQGEKAPSFETLDQDNNLVNLKDFLGQWVIVYFYPKDNTPGCTTQAKDFTHYLTEFSNLGVKIIGISPDSLTSHQKFRDKHNLSITLLSDPEHKIAENYGVWQLKKFMGKEYMGIIRTTFLINPEGNIAHLWTKVKVKGHVESVLNYCQNFGNK